MHLSQALIFFSVLFYGLIHSLLAAHGVKAFVQRWFGPAADRWYRLTYNYFGILSFLPILGLVAALPDRLLYVIPTPWIYLALGGQFAAAAAAGVTILQTGLWTFLGLQQALGNQGGEADKLVTTGLYRWVRHPLYSVGLVFIWLTPVMTANLLTMNLGLTLYLIVGAHYEERKLVRVFGEEYVRYRARTPMLVPRPRLRRQEAEELESRGK